MRRQNKFRIVFKLVIVTFFFFSISSLYAQAPANDSVADALLVTDINFTDSGVNINQAAQILQGEDCTIPDSNPSSPFAAVVYKFSPTSAGDVTVTIDSPSGTSTVNFYSAASLNATIGSELTLLSSCGTRSTITYSCSQSQAYYVSVVNTGGSSDISFSGDAVLPVELTLFSSEIFNSYIRLYWETATEINNFGFEIQRKNNDEPTNWETIDFVPGSGNSFSPKSYEFIDENPPVGNLEYRLKQIDTDGMYQYYGESIHINNSITGIDQDTQLPKEFALFQNYPNPFNPNTIISYSIPQKDFVHLGVYNALGKIVAKLVNKTQAQGSYNVNFNANNLPSGIYFYTIETNNFTNTKKMILLK